VVSTYRTGRVEVHALAPGQGNLAVTYNGETVSTDLVAMDLERVTLAHRCGEDAFAMPAGTRFWLDYQLWGADDTALIGRLEPMLVDAPLGPALTVVDGSASYDAPAEPADYPIVSSLDDGPAVTLTVYDPADLELSVVETNMYGNWNAFPHLFRYEVTQELEGRPVCVAVETEYVWRSTTPDVCLVRSGLDLVAEIVGSDAQQIQTSGPGTCRFEVRAVELSAPAAGHERTFDPIE
jgi:hypothetical protein